MAGEAAAGRPPQSPAGPVPRELHRLRGRLDDTVGSGGLLARAQMVAGPAQRVGRGRCIRGEFDRVGRLAAAFPRVAVFVGALPGNAGARVREFVARWGVRSLAVTGGPPTSGASRCPLVRPHFGPIGTAARARRRLKKAGDPRPGAKDPRRVRSPRSPPVRHTAGGPHVRARQGRSRARRGSGGGDGRPPAPQAFPQDRR